MAFICIGAIVLYRDNDLSLSDHRGGSRIYHVEVAPESIIKFEISNEWSVHREALLKQSTGVSVCRIVISPPDNLEQRFRGASNDIIIEVAFEPTCQWSHTTTEMRSVIEWNSRNRPVTAWFSRERYVKLNLYDKWLSEAVISWGDVSLLISQSFCSDNQRYKTCRSDFDSFVSSLELNPS